MPDRTAFDITVTRKGQDDIYTTVWKGKTITAKSPMELDALLDKVEAPRPRYFDAVRKEA